MTKNIKNIVDFIIWIFLIAIVSTLVVWSVPTAMKKNDIAKCSNLERQSVEFSEVFFITEQEYKYCKAVGFEIDAPVKK